MPAPARDFASRARAALGDSKLRANLRRAMDGLMTKRREQFADADEQARLRALGESVRRRALEQLPELLERLEERCTANGMMVHWAESGEEANRIILDILKRCEAKTVVKGKSMASEEIHLNAFLEGQGIEALETDLGEYVIQLAGEAPSHIIMPCIHKNRDDIARLFEQRIDGAGYTEDPAALTAIARKVLRQRFAQAGAGLSGVNMAVAETGTLVLVENEGNGRMSTTVPPVHIAVMGLEKVVERLEDITPLLSLLTRSATGQPITTYVNMINGPRRGADRDGPREVHLVLIDNGRTRIHADPDLRPTLQCIRCGACLNHCPVYARVGGHAYGAVYPGPIGKILTPQLEGLDRFGDLPVASSLCNACAEVCPVNIPIPRILVRLRDAAAGRTGKATPPVKGCGARRSRMEDAAWQGWKWMYANPRLYRVLSRLVLRFGPLMPSSAPGLDCWTKVRARPHFAKRTLHQRLEERGTPDA